MGDDEPDVPMMQAAGFSACPADAEESARRAATVVLKRKGGRGAVREFIEILLGGNRGAEGGKRAVGGRQRTD